MRASILLSVFLLLHCDGPSDHRTPAAAEAPPVDQESEAGERSECVSEWVAVDPGVRYRTAGCNGDEFELHVVELDPERWTIDVASGERRPMRDAIDVSQARFAINASFFDVNDRPLGVIVSSGRVRQKAHPVAWQSVFFIDRDGRPRIVDREKWAELEDDAFAAVQAGPRLVIAGEKNRVRKADPSKRSGVCLTRDGAIRFFVSAAGAFLDVHEMVELASKSEAAGGMGCHDAMLFDGGPSAQMFLDTSERKIDLAGDVVPVYVVAKPRGPVAVRSDLLSSGSRE